MATISKETVQNWVTFIVMVIGIGLILGGYAWALYILGGGVVMALFIIFKRRFPKRPTVLMIIPLLAGLYVPLSYWLVAKFPWLYGEELDALFVWGLSLFGASLVVIVFTSVELFKKTKP